MNGPPPVREFHPADPPEFTRRFEHRSAPACRMAVPAGTQPLSVCARDLGIENRRCHRRCSVSALIYSQGLYDYNNMQLVRWLLRDGGVFFDIGANIGSYSLVASEQTEAIVVAFEPHPATFRLLQENMILNQRRNVIAWNTALGRTDGMVWFTDQAGSSINHVLSGQSREAITVPARRADRCIEEIGHVPQFVKLDVEGHEYDVLAGFGQYLGSVGVVMIEMNGLSDDRGPGRQAIHAALKQSGLDGPWQFDFDRRTLRCQVGRSHEDSLYVSAQYQHVLSTQGWAIKAIR